MGFEKGLLKMVEWQRKRRPQDVPAPVAIALSDYCRRAENPTEGEQVREALALLTTSDDARVRALADTEPAEKPLGPFAVIDLLMGTPARLAAERQRTGYYELVRQLVSSQAPDPAPSAPPLAARATPRPPLPMPKVSAPLPPIAEAQEEVEPPPPSPPSARAKKGKKAKTKARLSPLEKRIAPRHKKAGTPATPPRPMPPEKPSGFRKRDLPAPRGIYSNVTAVKQKTEVLSLSRSKEFLEGLVAQSETRYGVWKALAMHYTTKGKPISLHDVELALEHHGLLDTLATKEHDCVVSQVAQSRGGLERAAKGLGLKNKGELLALAKVVGAKKSVDAIRDRFVREALSPAHLTSRLDLAGKFKYLADLGIARQFDTALTRDLKELFDQSPNADVFEVSRRTGFNAEMLERAATRLGLLQPER
jgi:hypothetical protein